MALQFLIDRIIKQREYGAILLSEIEKERIEEVRKEHEAKKLAQVFLIGIRQNSLFNRKKY